VKTIFKKSSAKAAMAVTAAKRQEVTAIRNAVFSRRRCCDAVWRRRRVLFLSKKVAKWYKILKDC
jgi:hypothetical protein